MAQMKLGNPTSKFSVQQRLEMLEEQVMEIERFTAQIFSILATWKSGPESPGRKAYSIEEAAEILDRSSYTVREWARHGRINAFKRGDSGSKQIWNITVEEIERIKEEGLLPVDRLRNAE